MGDFFFPFVFEIICFQEVQDWRVSKRINLSNSKLNDCSIKSQSLNFTVSFLVRDVVRNQKIAIPKKKKKYQIPTSTSLLLPCLSFLGQQQSIGHQHSAAKYWYHSLFQNPHFPENGCQPFLCSNGHVRDVSSTNGHHFSHACLQALCFHESSDSFSLCTGYSHFTSQWSQKSNKHFISPQVYPEQKQPCHK